MYDETEDVFNINNDEKRQYGKAFINRALETNEVPTIWITNNIYSMDEAVVRRFNLAIELGVPNENMRAKIIKEYSANLIDNKLIKKLAKNQHVAPAVVSNASLVVSNLNARDKNKAFERVISNTLKAQGYGAIEKDEKKDKSSDDLPSSYDPNFVNSNCDLNELMKGIKESKSARVCLYGVPGTGKSTYAKFKEAIFYLCGSEEPRKIWPRLLKRLVAKKQCSYLMKSIAFYKIEAGLQEAGR